MSAIHLSNKMRVSFDLDEVLFVNPDTHKTEPELRFPFNRIYKERIRYGTADLIKELRKRDIEVWVYTSSYRTQRYIKWLFRHYGVKFDGIVNAQRHNAEVQAGNAHTLPQKLPNKYRISLHIDDEEIVAIYGKSYGFNVYQLNAQDDDWEEKILKRVDSIKKNQQA